jgi:hypothetical protein
VQIFRLRKHIAVLRELIQEFTRRGGAKHLRDLICVNLTQNGIEFRFRFGNRSPQKYAICSRHPAGG